MRKLPHYIEDVFTLDKKTVDGKCIIHVLDCCKLPWLRVRSVALETSGVNDFSIIDCSPCNIIVSTNTSQNLIQGFNFANGNLLWNIDGMSYNIVQPCKIASSNQDEIYITDSESLKAKNWTFTRSSNVAKFLQLKCKTVRFWCQFSKVGSLKQGSNVFDHKYSHLVSHLINFPKHKYKYAKALYKYSER